MASLLEQIAEVAKEFPQEPTRSRRGATRHGHRGHPCCAGAIPDVQLVERIQEPVVEHGTRRANPWPDLVTTSGRPELDFRPSFAPSGSVQHGML